MQDWLEILTEVLAEIGLDGLDLVDAEKLAGGVVSLVISAKRNGQPIVIKHTLDNIPVAGPFSFPDQTSLLSVAPHTHALDGLILSHLQDLDIVVPSLLHFSPEKRVTVMSDFRENGYGLLQDQLVNGELSKKSALEIGRALAKLTMIFSQLPENIDQVEDSTIQARERLEELHGFLRPQLDLYRKIERKFLAGKHLIYTDGHPKNLALHAEDGSIMIFDFGRSIVADPQFVAPNFAAHIGLAVLGGCFRDARDGISYIQEFITAYNSEAQAEYKIDEGWFVTYFMAEILHRGLSGRWIDGRIFSTATQQEVEKAVHAFAIDVFRPQGNESITTIDDLLSSLSKYSKLIQSGFFSLSVDEALEIMK